MIYLEKIEVLKHNYPGSKVLDKDFIIECSDVTLLVGDQGCGKSTLLKMLQTNSKDIKVTISEFTKLNGVNTYYFDSEKDNPRIKDPELFTKPSGENIGMGYRGAIMSRFRSHGEILKELTVDCINSVKNCVVILDEPESGLSLTNQFKLVESIKKAVENNCQLFIATHCYPLIKEFNVVSLEHKKHMSGIDFIDLIKKQ